MFGVVAFAQEEVPKAQLASSDLEVGDNGYDGLPARSRIGGKLGVSNSKRRRDLFLQTLSRHVSISGGMRHVQLEIQPAWPASPLHKVRTCPQSKSQAIEWPDVTPARGRLLAVHTIAHDEGEVKSAIGWVDIVVETKGTGGGRSGA